MERILQPRTEKRGGRREDDKMEEAQGSSSTVPKTEEFSRPDGFELDIVWFAIARLNSDEEAKAENGGQYTSQQISDQVCQNMLTKQYPPENLRILETEIPQFQKYAINGILAEASEFFTLTKQNLAYLKGSEALPPSVRKLQKNEPSNKTKNFCHIEHNFEELIKTVTQQRTSKTEKAADTPSESNTIPADESKTIKTDVPENKAPKCPKYPEYDDSIAAQIRTWKFNNDFT